MNVTQEDQSSKRVRHDVRESATDATMAALEETGCRKCEAWWTIYMIGVQLGLPAVAALVGEAQAVHAAGGMMLGDGSRPRTLGGVFFKLAQRDLSLKRWRFWVTPMATKRWATRWLRKMAALPGGRPTTREGIEKALAMLGDAPSAHGIRTLVKMAAEVAPKPAPKASEFVGVKVNACQVDARTPEAQEALAELVVAAKRLMTEPAKPAAPKQRRPAMPEVEVIQARRRG